jgi:CMP-N-acetylneuraminic acid synthetase
MLPNRESKLGSGFAVAIIPARGGSKGIPRKNLQLCGDVTLLERAIRTCQQSSLLTRVFVSTEDTEIKRHATDCGATVIDRADDLATCHSTTADVLLHAIQTVPISSMVTCLVQCTAPLLTPDDIDGTIGRLLETDADVSIACAESHDFLVRPGFDGRLRGVGYELPAGLPRRQDLPRTLVIAGSVWAFNTERFLSSKSLYTENSVAYEVARRLDIDSPSDLSLAGRLLSPENGTMRTMQIPPYYPH